jgi:hypothetical protein
MIWLYINSGGSSPKIGGDAAWAFYELPATIILPTAYVGPLFRARRSSDNAVADFYQGASIGIYDTVRGGGGTELKTWLGASAAGFIVKLYDQIGSNDLVQSNAGKQPVFYDLGTSSSLVNNRYFESAGVRDNIDNTILALLSDTVSGSMDFTTPLETYSKDYEFIAISGKNNIVHTGIIAGNTSNFQPYPPLHWTDGNIYFSDQVNYVGYYESITKAKIVSGKNIGGSKTLRTNGVLKTTTVSGTNSGSASDKVNTFLGGILNGTSGGRWVQALIMFTDGVYNQANVELELSQSNQVQLDDLNIVPKVLDYILNTEVAYALVELNSSYTGPVCRLRRFGDNVGADFYQGATVGSLNTVRGGGGTDALTWVTQGGGTGVAAVTKLYDQSGNGNNAGQTNVAHQAGIIDASSYTNTLNGLPTLTLLSGTYYTLDTPVSCVETWSNAFVGKRRTSSVVLMALADDTTINTDNCYSVIHYLDNRIYSRSSVGYHNTDIRTFSDHKIYFSVRNSTNSSIYVDNTQETAPRTSVSGATTFTTLFRRAMSNLSTFEYSDGQAQAIILWRKDKNWQSDWISRKLNQIYGAF